jgi:hypothetical protein
MAAPASKAAPSDGGVAEAVVEVWGEGLDVPGGGVDVVVGVGSALPLGPVHALRASTSVTAASRTTGTIDSSHP